MKNDAIDHQGTPPLTLTAQDALRLVADKLRRGGAKLPMTLTTGASTAADLVASGLSIALCAVEVEFDVLAAAAPRDNQAHHALFTLPPIQASASTNVAVPVMPAQKVVTGDNEVDAVLWLREVIGTGRADLIEKAYEAAARIKTPLSDLEKRYTAHLARANPGNWAACMASLGFADLTGLAQRAITRNKRQQDAHARFGDTIFEQTSAERFCEEAMDGLQPVPNGWDLDKAQVDQRFDSAQGQRPGTLMQCVIELEYWNDLYWLREAVGGTAAGDYTAAVSARQDYLFRMLSRIPPRGPVEAAEVLRYLASNDGLDRAQTGAILMNLVGAPEPYRPHEAGGTNA